MTRRRALVRSSVDEIAASLVERLYRDVAQESVVVFTGGGSTTERGLHGQGFYELIKQECAYSDEASRPSFPSLMKYYCDNMDGGHHNRLIGKVIGYLEEFSLPGESRQLATRTPDLLAELPYFNRFVTTNWDPFLERALDVLVPIIEDRDLAFWVDRKRQVLKIHGCVTRPYSIIATESDYTRCIADSPLIFNKLKDLMATKTFLFVGYSMRDQDFREIWSSITAALGRFAKLAYAVDPHAVEEDISYWRERGIAIFRTSDMAVLEAFRKRFEEEDLIPTQEFIEHLKNQRRRLVNIHLELHQNSDGAMASSMYQDGLLHGLTDVVTSSLLGSKRSRDFEAEASDAVKQIRKYTRAKNAVEVAYWSGQKEVLRRFCDRNDTSIPSYFHPYKLAPVSKFVRGQLWKEGPARLSAS